VYGDINRCGDIVGGFQTPGKVGHHFC
jgi:hypothetical protein